MAHEQSERCARSATVARSMRLFREIGLASSVFLVVGNIIGIGIFTTSGLIAAEVGNSVWLIGVWVLGGVLALIGAVCYSILGVRIPRAGGEYAFLYPCYGPLPAFLSGWTSLLIGFSAPIAASALGLAHYLRSFLPLQISGHAVTPKVVATLVLLSVTLLLSLGLKFGTRIHSLFTLVNFALVVAFAFLVLGNSAGSPNLGLALQRGLFDVHLPSLGSALVLVMFAYSGWNAAAYVAEEIRAPERTIPVALILGTLAVIVAYVFINLAYFSAVPLAALEGKIAVAEIAASKTLGTMGLTLVSTLIAVSILSSLTAMSIAGPRVYFAMSRDRLFPGWMAEVHEKKKIPLKSIWFQSGVAAALIALGTLYQILLYSGFILLLFATLTVSTLLTVKKADKGLFWARYRLLPGIFVATNTGILISAVISHPAETLTGLVTVALGLPVFWYYRREATPTATSTDQ